MLVVSGCASSRSRVVFFELDGREEGVVKASVPNDTVVYGEAEAPLGATPEVISSWFSGLTSLIGGRFRFTGFRWDWYSNDGN